MTELVLITGMCVAIILGFMLLLNVWAKQADNHELDMMRLKAELKRKAK